MSLSVTQSKEKKRLYDIEYRRKNKEMLRLNKQEYYKTDAGRATSKRNRDKLTEYHLEYCQTDKYREWKKEYDKDYRAKNKYGEYWECFLIIMEIEKIVKERIPDRYERMKARGYFRAQTIKRVYKRHLLYGWKFNY